MMKAIDFIAVVVVIFAILHFFFVKDGPATAQGQLNFKTYGLPPTRSFAPFGDRRYKTLVSAGMRRKVIIDVYKVGLYVSDAKLKQLEQKKGAFEKTLSESSDSGKASTVVSLEFMRSVGTDKIVDAIISALSGKGKAYQSALEKFRQTLLDAIGANGAAKGDTIDFVLTGRSSNEISVGVNGKSFGSIKNAELRQKLVKIYVGAKSVAPELVDILKKTY
jgi:hypothetical protein